jgi:hypothetical protein
MRAELMVLPFQDNCGNKFDITELASLSRSLKREREWYSPGRLQQVWGSPWCEQPGDFF